MSPKGGTSESGSHLHPRALPTVTHVLKVDGHRDGVIFKQVVSLWEKPRSEELGTDPERRGHGHRERRTGPV